MKQKKTKKRYNKAQPQNGDLKPLITKLHQITQADGRIKMSNLKQSDGQRSYIKSKKFSYLKFGKKVKVPLFGALPPSKLDI